MKKILVRESKYGVALVLETSEFSGSYVLGFRIENVDAVFEEVSQLFKSFKSKPFFGVQCFFEDAETNIDLLTIAHKEDNMEIVETGYEHVRSIQNTYLVNKKAPTNANDGLNVVFNEDLGLACEPLP
jgi:Bardet-Biedl syndrome 5 protein